ncbi:hypothetical protein [Tenggerimyces flavus]|uniref:Twin-arginine translocation signal domain-containing protein n=1 Tax=Tenggerimyces flavus TaxID=1708749 RepID=A0ABV7Y705_9ACTN|nr:hypothetical protein [Tenggerimyces flavus]MBM7788517.1 hypothetical protein [Tenggerimyces flavus]
MANEGSSRRAFLRTTGLAGAGAVSLGIARRRGGSEHRFLAHLRDLTENGQPSEFASIDKVFDVLDRKRFGYSVLAGKHLVRSSTDDQRGDSAYLQTFGPHRFAHSPTFQGSSPGGYNSYTCSAPRAASGWCSRWTGGRRPAGWSGLVRCWPSIRVRR